MDRAHAGVVTTVAGPAACKNWAEKGFWGVSPDPAEDATTRTPEIETLIIIWTVTNRLVWKILFPMQALPYAKILTNKRFFFFFFFFYKCSALFLIDCSRGGRDRNKP